MEKPTNKEKLNNGLTDREKKQTSKDSQALTFTFPEGAKK